MSPAFAHRLFRFPEARVRNREDGREPREGLPSLPDGATARAEALSAGPLEVPSEDEQRDANAIFSLEKNPSPPAPPAAMWLVWWPGEDLSLGEIQKIRKIGGKLDGNLCCQRKTVILTSFVFIMSQVILTT